MTCEERIDQLLLFAAGALDPDEERDLRAHLAMGCFACQGSLAQAQAMLALLPLTLDPMAPDPALKKKILDRVAMLEKRNEALAGPIPIRPSQAAGRPAPFWMQLLLPSAIAASVAAILTIVYATRINPPSNQVASGLNDIQIKLAELTAMARSDSIRPPIGSLVGDNGNADQPNLVIPASFINWACCPQLHTVYLEPRHQPPDARARIFWDVPQNSWHFFATGLTPAPSGKVYELWYVSSNGKVCKPAGKFTPDASGDAMLETAVPPQDAGVIDVAAVTDEPADSDMQKPTGTFQLKGEMSAGATGPAN